MRSRGVGFAIVASLLVVVVLLFTCGENGPSSGEGDAGSNTKCAMGLKSMGPACVPIFDECQDDEIPMLGGGCKRVGVKECLGGWGIAGPPDWKCKPIGPPRTCPKGWAKVKGGWCEPILPKTKCPKGTMEKIGYATCQQIGDCGTGKWGKIKITSSTIFVDQSYTGDGSDGSQSMPFVTIGAALYNATAGAHIAVATGTYKENVSIVRKVTLEGRCAQKVTIVGMNTIPAVTMKKWANGTVLRGVTISGAGAGLNVDGVAATVERVAARGCEGSGIWVDSGGTLTLRDSLVAGNRYQGIFVASSRATVERSVVRDTRGLASNKKFGTGIQVSVGLGGQSKGSELVLRDSLVSGNRTIGIDLGSSKATVERSVVRDTHERASDKKFGTGIQASVWTGTRFGSGQGSELVLRDSLVAGNRTAGVLVASSKATVERSVVRDTREQASDKVCGWGIQVSARSDQSPGSELVLRDSLVAGNRNAGIVVLGSKAIVERSVVRDTQEQASDKKHGVGIEALFQVGKSQGSDLVLRDSLVARNRESGILLASSKATVERSIVRDTRERVSDNTVGTGIQANVQPGQNQGSELTLLDSLVIGNRTIGIDVESSKATVERSVVCDTLEEASGKGLGTGIQANLLPGQSRGSELVLRDSLVAGNRNAGIVVQSSKATVERSVVRDTHEQFSDKKSGMGIGAITKSDHSPGSELVLRNSLVSNNRQAGIVALNSTVTVERSVVCNNRKDVLGLYGDGLAAGKKSTLHVSDTAVESSARAGFLFDNSGGSMRRCLIRRNVFAIDLEQGANPTVGTDNLLIDNKVNKVTRGQGLKAAPMPSAPNPLGTDAGTGATKDAGSPP